MTRTDGEDGSSRVDHTGLGRFTALSLSGVALLWTVYYVGREMGFLSTTHRSVVSLLAVGLLALSTRHIIGQVYHMSKIKGLVGLGAFLLILSELGHLLRKVALTQDVLPLTHWFTVSMAHTAAVAQYAGILFFFASFFLCIFETEAAKRRLAKETRELAREVGERKQAEESLERIFNLSPDMICTVGEDGFFKNLNPAWEEVLGYTRTELLAEPVVGFVHPDDVDATLAEIANQAEGEPTIRFENRFRRKDGSYRALEWRATPSLEGVLYGVARDITERRRAEKERRQFEEQMQQAQKLESLGVMAGGIAHDFNNILFAILGNADIALMEMPPEALGRDCLLEIQTAARRATGLTDQMLAYSGKGALAISKMDLSELVRDMARLLEVSHAKKAVVKYRLGEDLSAIQGDASQLRQVVVNLITNASEAVGEEGGIVAVKTGVTEATREYLATTYGSDEFPGGRYVYLEVADSGCGMDTEAQRRIFEPFFTTKFTGRGLGMAAVLGITRAHGGAIDIKSEVDRGTTVTVLFPALDEPIEPSVDEGPREDEWSAQGTVLVVDDESQVRNLLKLVLERKGFAVLTADDGRQATDVYRENVSDIVCVLLDLTMPHMSGEETYAELRRLREDVRVILVSGYSEDELEERVENLGFAGFLKKPVGSRELLEKVRTVLDLAG